MTKEALNAAVLAVKQETKEALQSIYDCLNQGQQKKLCKDAVASRLLARYEVVL